MRALGFLGVTRLAEANRILPSLLTQWRSQWCMQDGAELATECLDECSRAIELAGPCEWRRVSVGRANVWFAADWRKLLFGSYAADAPRDDVADKLIDAAQMALASCLLEALGCDATVAIDGEAPFEPGALLGGRLVCTQGHGAERLMVLLDPSLLASCLPEAQRVLPLVTRSSAIGGVRLRIKVSVPFAKLPAGEVSNLTPGDILQGHTHFLEPLDLSVQDGKTVAKGFLARRNEHLALQLTAHE